VARPDGRDILDLVWMHHRGTMRRRDRFGMEVVTRVSARRADRVIALSEAARDDLVQTLGVARERVDVTPLGVRIGGSAAPMPEPELRSSLDLGSGRIVLCVAQQRAELTWERTARATFASYRRAIAQRTAGR
jgi:hypothetical protein